MPVLAIRCRRLRWTQSVPRPIPFTISFHSFHSFHSIPYNSIPFGFGQGRRSVALGQVSTAEGKAEGSFEAGQGRPGPTAAEVAGAGRKGYWRSIGWRARMEPAKGNGYENSMAFDYPKKKAVPGCSTVATPVHSAPPPPKTRGTASLTRDVRRGTDVHQWRAMATEMQQNRTTTTTFCGCKLRPRQARSSNSRKNIFYAHCTNLQRQQLSVPNTNPDISWVSQKITMVQNYAPDTESALERMM